MNQQAAGPADGRAEPASPKQLRELHLRVNVQDK